MFISPWRSELKAIIRPSGDQAPRLSSRVETTTGVGGPVAAPVSGETGSCQRSALRPRTANASRWPSGAGVGSMSSPAPVVSCRGAPAAWPSAPTAMRQTLIPPPRFDGEVDPAPVGRPRRVLVGRRIVRHARRRVTRDLRRHDIGVGLLDPPEDQPPAVRRPARAGVDHGLARIGGELPRIPPRAIADPDPPGTRPCRIEGESGAVGRPGRPEGVGDERRLRGPTPGPRSRRPHPRSTSR